MVVLLLIVSFTVSPDVCVIVCLVLVLLRSTKCPFYLVSFSSFVIISPRKIKLVA